ncbi:hypothetical protein C2G38_2179844 [Gigaspora rosea]|uniref:Uncharacterized protein n=1 Tax=Gigaspora rosea TaxID=44941 RepID=A0A397UP01_9GLOM|nr:hypothetical protein C2G38_2202276 [Gigaspora rosea]RIB20200.1 hypothetical protein C2G38_2179844 [Gigaspora rosea]
MKSDVRDLRKGGFCNGVGSPDEKSGQTGIVKFPRPGTNSDEVTLKDDKELVEKIKIELERLVEEQSNLTDDIKKTNKKENVQISFLKDKNLHLLLSHFSHDKSSKNYDFQDYVGPVWYKY